MSRISFENYGKLVNECIDPTIISGRYLSQREQERNILVDIINKLKINSHDTCLDIGCSVGNILIPLSFLVKFITGIDHPNCIEALKKRINSDNINLIEGNFIDIDEEEIGKFDKILIYSVLHYLSDEQEVMFFIKKSLSLVNPGGKLLLGDLPNVSRKKRFINSEFGKEFDKNWKIQNIDQSSGHFTKDHKNIIFNDALILSIISKIRDMGHHAYILPQPSFLPCGYTREDILIEILT